MSAFAPSTAPSTAVAGAFSLNIDPNRKIEPTGLPDGDYIVRMTALDPGTTAAGESKLTAVFTVLGGQFSNRKHFENYNIGHHNPQTAAIANDSIVRLCQALGFTRLIRGLDDLNALLVHASQHPLRITLKTRGDFSNIKKYAATEPVAAVAQPQAAPTAAPATTGWSQPAAPAAGAAAPAATPWGAQPAAATA